MVDVDVLQQLQDIAIFKQKIDKVIAKNSVNKKIMAVDFGTKKIGIALSDEAGLLAFPKDILIGDWLSVDAVIGVIMQQINMYHPVAIVFGLPKTLHGELHKNCQIIISVAENINKILPVLLFDERFTTQLANRNIYEKQMLFYNGKKNNNRKANSFHHDDSLSAMIVLNDVLKRLSSSSIFTNCMTVLSNK